MTPFELSCGLPPGPDFADLAVLAEALGYRRVWIYDSASLWEDPLVHLALAAVRTTRAVRTAVRLGPRRAGYPTAWVAPPQVEPRDGAQYRARGTSIGKEGVDER